MRTLIVALFAVSAAFGQAMPIVVAGVPAPATPPATPPSVVSSIAGDTNGGNQPSVQSAADNLSAGNAVVVGCFYNFPCSSITQSVTDLSSGANTFTQIGSHFTDAANETCSSLFYAKNAAAVTNNKYTCTMSTATAQQAVSAIQISGASTTAPLVGGLSTASTPGGSGGNTVGPTANFSPTSGSIVICFGSIYEPVRTATLGGTGTWTLAGAYATPNTGSIAPTTAQSFMGYQQYSSGTSGQNASFTFSGAVGFGSDLCATFSH